MRLGEVRDYLDRLLKVVDRLVQLVLLGQHDPKVVVSRRRTGEHLQDRAILRDRLDRLAP